MNSLRFFFIPRLDRRRQMEWKMARCSFVFFCLVFVGRFRFHWMPPHFSFSVRSRISSIKSMDASMIFFYRRHQMEWKIAYFLHFFLCVRVCVASRTLKEGGGQPESLRSRFRQFCDLFFFYENTWPECQKLLCCRCVVECAVCVCAERNFICRFGWVGLGLFRFVSFVVRRFGTVSVFEGPDWTILSFEGLD